MALSLNAWKGLSMVVFTAISILGAAIAVIMKDNAKQLYISCGVLFSAGVLLAGGFVHLLAESNATIVEETGSDFPWAIFIAGLAIVGLACLEISLDRAVDKYVTKHSGQCEDDKVVENGCCDEHTEAEDLSLTGPLVPPSRDNPAEELPQTEGEFFFNEQDHDHMHVHPENSFSAIILTLALSVHSVVEGFGIGASTNISDIQSAFIAVVAHKGFTAFALAQGMVGSGYWADEGKRKYFYVSIGTFVGVNLLGIAIGWAISSSIENSVVTASLIAVTAGSFIYVAMLEILPNETKTIKRQRLFLPLVLFSFIAGYCLMAMLAIWV